MRKLTPEERLKHGVIVLLKKEDYEDLKRFAEETNSSQAAWARKLVLSGLQRQRRIEKSAKDAAAERQAELDRQEAEALAAAEALKAKKPASKKADAAPEKEKKAKAGKAKSKK